MTTKELINSLPQKNRIALEILSNIIAVDKRRDHQAGASDTAARLDGYLACLQDTGTVTYNGRRALALWYRSERVRHILENPVKIQVTYLHETANGNWIEHTCVADSKEEAETICEDIESKPDSYKLVDVTRID